MAYLDLNDKSEILAPPLTTLNTVMKNCNTTVDNMTKLMAVAWTRLLILLGL